MIVGEGKTSALCRLLVDADSVLVFPVVRLHRKATNRCGEAGKRVTPEV
jgi:hypothetical protein